MYTNSTENSSRKSVSEIVTEKIIKEMENGTVPWERPWIALEKQNLVSRKPYHGINRLLLSFDSEEFYISFNQVKALGGRVNAGAHSKMVIFWKPVDKTKKITENEEEKQVMKDYSFILRYYNVFSLEDTTGIERPTIGTDKPKQENIEEFLKRINPDIKYIGSRACYNTDTDSITVPEISRFSSVQHYYSTVLHELIHWTGSDTRCKRFKDSNSYNLEAYGKEELTAELGAAILCHHFNVEILPHNAAYIQGWLNNIKADKKLLLGACSRAEKAIAYLGIQ